jgi:hypothetical protein
MFQFNRCFSTGLVSLFLLTASACESSGSIDALGVLPDGGTNVDTQLAVDTSPPPPDTNQSAADTGPQPTGSSCAALAASMGSPSDLNTSSLYDVVATYADLPVAETWSFESDLDIRTLAPEFIEVYGVTRIYTPRSPKGIATFTNPSGDNVTWTGEEVVVPETPTERYGHPYGATAPDGTFYLFMQVKDAQQAAGPPENQGPQPLTVSVSTSTDGETFTAPQPALSCTDVGLEACAHGRITKLDNGCYLMAVSASVARKHWKPLPWLHDDKPQNPTYIPGNILALSDNLKDWTFTGTYFRGCHDPTFIQDDDRFSLVCHNESSNSLIRFDSTNGLDFNPLQPAGRVAILAPDGESMTENSPALQLTFGDIDWHVFPDGSDRLFVSVNENAGIPGQVKPTVWSFTRSD